jgi:diaminopimelate decarboxylase
LHYFKYKRNVLYAEDVPVDALAARYGTPLYVYSHKTLLRHYCAYDDAFKHYPHIICYALKANSNAAVLRVFANEGGGADIVSGGELARALAAGIDPKKIVYAGVGKTETEIEAALKTGILMFNVESAQELSVIDETAGKLGLRAPVALRVNPDVDPQTHPYISTGLKKNKFGIPFDEALESYRHAATLKNIEIVGIHKHIGSQITKAAPFVDSLKRLLALVDILKAEGIGISCLDIGGGLGIQYRDEEPPLPRELVNKLRPLLKGRDVTIVLEPGRSLVGNAGILVVKALYVKRGAEKNFLIVDGGMNDLIRPAMYDAYHRIVPVRKTKRGAAPGVSGGAALRRKLLTDVVGPICESGDFLGKDREMPELSPGEFAAVMSAGAYGFSMSSNYNSRMRAAEVMVKGAESFLIRRRETIEDIVRGEEIPPFLKS